MVVEPLDLPEERIFQDNTLCGPVNGIADMIGESQIDPVAELFSQRSPCKADDLIGYLNTLQRNAA